KASPESSGLAFFYGKTARTLSHQQHLPGSAEALLTRRKILRHNPVVIDSRGQPLPVELHLVFPLPDLLLLGTGRDNLTQDIKDLDRHESVFGKHKVDRRRRIEGVGIVLSDLVSGSLVLRTWRELDPPRDRDSGRVW